MAAQLDMALGGSGLATGWASTGSNKRKSSGYWEEEREMVVQLMMGRPHHLDVNRPSSNSYTTSAPAGPAAPALMAAPFFPTQPAASCSTATTTLDLLGSSPPSASAALPYLSLQSDDASSCSSCCFDLDCHSPLPTGWEKCLDLQTGNIYYLSRGTGVSTSCDPRKVAALYVNWPASPSSSSDLTCEASVSMASSSKPGHTTLSFMEGTNDDPSNLDLSLSLKPSSPCLWPSSLNHSLNHNPSKSNRNLSLRSLISAQSLHSSSQSFASNNVSAGVTFNSKSRTKTASASTVFLQDVKGGGLAGSSNSLCGKESNAMVSMSQGFSGAMARSSMSMMNGGREVPMMMREMHVESRSFCNGGEEQMISPLMMTVGCPNCLMFVMLPRSCSPKCPRCGASIDPDLPPPPSSFKKPKLAGFPFS